MKPRLSKNPRVRRIQIRKLRKQELIQRGAMQAKLAKARLMMADKGRNGHSMNETLIAAHGIQRKGEATA